MQKDFLVTVCVITYNSENYILDTLESIKRQTYNNIELIISDDCSKDSTKAICMEWIAKNSSRFVRAEFVSPIENMGTSCNYNRAANASKGDWIKYIDGDDLLADSCVEENIKFVKNNPEVKVIFSQVSVFSEKNVIPSHVFFNEKKKSLFDLDAKGQFMRLLLNNDLPSASFFVNAQLIKENPFDERYRLVEDAPKWIDLTHKGYRFYYFDTITAYYRKAESATHGKKRYYNPLYIESLFQYVWDYKIPLLRQYNHQEAYTLCRQRILIIEFIFAVLKNRRNRFNDFILRVFSGIIYRLIKYKL